MSLIRIFVCSFIELTGLTLGGFIQPSIARNPLEQPTNINVRLWGVGPWVEPWTDSATASHWDTVK